MATITTTTISTPLKLEALQSEAIAKLSPRVKVSEEEIKDIKERQEKYKKDEKSDYNLYGTIVDIDDDGLIRVKKSERETSKYPDWLPVWDPLEKYEPYQPFEIKDRGLDADPNLINLFPNGIKNHKVKRLNPNFGSEVRDVQLSELTDKGKNDLAKFVAERGVVVFRDQDLKDKGPKFAAEYGLYFGPQHIHPVTGSPEGVPEIHIVYKPENGYKPEDTHYKTRSKANYWHSDVSYEKNTPSVTFLGLLEGPEAGGDTAFVDTVTAFKRLSPTYQKFLKTLKVVHQGVKQADQHRKTIGIVRREPVTNTHPLIRTHPVTGEDAIFINPGFVTEIVGLKKEESDNLLEFLYDHLYTSVDLQLKASWEPGTVVIWDNRITSHTALYDWSSDERRHLFRITPRGEVPYQKDDLSL